jgi:hypothetical protein
MTDNKTELINCINNYIMSQTEKITKNDLKKAVGEIFDELTKTKKRNSEAKKRPPTEYNKFVKEHMAILKQQPDNKMNAKEKMEHIALLWKEQKQKKPEIKEEEPEKFKGKTPRKALGKVK